VLPRDTSPTNAVSLNTTRDPQDPGLRRPSTSNNGTSYLAAGLLSVTSGLLPLLVRLSGVCITVLKNVWRSSNIGATSFSGLMGCSAPPHHSSHTYPCTVSFFPAGDGSTSDLPLNLGPERGRALGKILRVSVDKPQGKALRRAYAVP